MSIDTTHSDLEAVLAAIADKRSVDPEIAKRVRERSEALSAEIRRKHGTLNVAVDLVREVRDSA